MTMDGSENDEELNKIIERKARELLKGAGNDVVELGEDGFESFVRSRKVVVVDFWRRGVLHVSC